METPASSPDSRAAPRMNQRLVVTLVATRTLLLHDTLKTLAVQESTKEAANVTINKFICITIILTNILSCSISILGTIVIYNHIKPTTNNNNHHQIVRTKGGLPDQLHRGVHDVGVQDVRDKRDQSLPVHLDQSLPVHLDQSQPVHLGQSQPVHLGQSQPVHLGQYQPVDKDQPLGVDDQPLPVDKGHPLPVGQPHLDSHYKINISVSKKNDSITEEDDDLQDFWMD